LLARRRGIVTLVRAPAYTRRDLGRVPPSLTDEFCRPQPSLPSMVNHSRRQAMTVSRTAGRTRPFRFGVTVPIRTDMPTWRDRLRRFAGSGYATVLRAGFPRVQPSPGPTLDGGAAPPALRGGHWLHALG